MGNLPSDPELPLAGSATWRGHVTSLALHLLLHQVGEAKDSGVSYLGIHCLIWGNCNDSAALGSTCGDPTAVGPGRGPGSSLVGITALGVSVGPDGFRVCGHRCGSFFL